MFNFFILLSGSILLSKAVRLPDVQNTSQCNIACPALYEPVCVRCEGDLKTYSSICEANRDNICYYKNCIYEHYGRCGEQTECSRVCPLIYQPVCGWNGNVFQTFSNMCQLNVRNHCDRQCFVKIADCECAPSSLSFVK